MSESKHKAMLVIAHPGHELRAFGWLMHNRPEVWIMTDGSGRKAAPRIEVTKQILREHQATTGSWLGAFSDLQVYEWVRKGNAQPFIDCTLTLTNALKSSGATTVVGDAMEGRIMSHDLVRTMINAAVLRCRLDGREILNFDFLLDSMPRLKSASDAAIELQLTTAEFSAKYTAAQNYEELRDEVRLALEKYGETPFRVEVFEPVSETAWMEMPADIPPHYELHGEEQVRKGVYPEVIRFREHVRPLMCEIWESLGLPLE